MNITRFSICQTIKNKILVAMFFLFAGIAVSVPRGTLAHGTDKLNAYQFGIRWNSDFEDVYVDDSPSFTERIINALSLYMDEYPNNRVFNGNTSYLFNVTNLRTILAPLATTPCYVDVVCENGEILYIKLSKDAFDNYDLTHLPSFEEYYTLFAKCDPSTVENFRFSFSDTYGYFNYSDGLDKYPITFNAPHTRTDLDGSDIGKAGYYARTSSDDNPIYYSNAVRRFLLDDATHYLYLYVPDGVYNFGSDRPLYSAFRNVLTYDLNDIGGIFQTQAYYVENITARRTSTSGNGFLLAYFRDDYNNDTMMYKEPLFVRFNKYNAIDHGTGPTPPTPTPVLDALPTPQAWITPTPSITYVPIEDLPSHSDEFTDISQFDHVPLYVYVMNAFMDTEIGLLIRWVLGFTAFLALLGFVPRFIDKDKKR